MLVGSACIVWRLDSKFRKAKLHSCSVILFITVLPFLTRGNYHFIFQSQGVMNVRRKWFVQPALTSEFVNYYHGNIVVCFL